MAQIRVDIASQDNATQDIQNLRREISRIGEEIARNNRIAERATDEERQRLALRNRELRLTRQVLSANRTAQTARLAGLRAEERATERVRRETERLHRTRTDVFRNIAFASGAATVGLVALGRSAVQAGIQMEGIVDGLTALEGSAEAAHARIASLREVIRQPGVEYHAAVQAAVELRAVGLEAGLANRVIQEFGNSLALVGRTDLRDTLLGLRQILSRGRVSQEELNQITERSSLLSQILQERFGTVLSEGIQSQLDQAGQNVIEGFLEPILDGLARLERAPVDSALNSLQNLGNAVFELRAALGEQLIPIVSRTAQGLTTAIEAFNAMDVGVRRAVVTIGGIVTGAAAATTVIAGLGAAIGALNAYLVSTTGVGGLAGFAALVAPAAPFLVGLGLVTAALAPLGIGLYNAAQRSREAREETRAFADQLRQTAAVLGDTSAIEARIKSLQQYIFELEQANAARERQLGTGAQRVFSSQSETGREFQTTRERIRLARRELAILQELNNPKTRELTIEQLRELDRIVASGLQEAQLRKNTEAVASYQAAAASLVEQFQRLEREAIRANSTIARSTHEALTPIERLTREAIGHLRRLPLELVNLNAEVSSAVNAFNNAQGTSEIEAATQRQLQALEAVTQARRDQIGAEIAVEGAALARVANQDRAESEHAQNLRRLRVELAQLDVDYEQEKTRITRAGADKRAQIEEEYARRQLEYDRRANAERERLQRERAAELQVAIRQIEEIENPEQRQRTARRFGVFLSRGLAPTQALQSAQNLITLTDGIENSINKIEPAARIVAATLQTRLVQGIQTANDFWERMGDNVRNTRAALLDLDVTIDDVARRQQNLQIGDSIARLEAGQAGRDQATRDRFGAGATVFRVNQERLNQQAEAFVGRIRLNNPAYQLGQRITEQIVNVPSDAISAAVEAYIEIPRQVEAELRRLDRRKLDRIADVNEEERLSAKEKEARILEIERDFARQRKLLEEEVSEAKINAFNAVVTNFTSGIARMVAAELRLRAAQGLTNYLIGAPGASDGGLLGRLFGGGTSAAGGASFLANPLVGLGLFAGATALTQLFSSSFHDPINDALARTAGQSRGTSIGRQSAEDLVVNYDRGFRQGLQQITAQNQTQERGSGERDNTGGATLAPGDRIMVEVAINIDGEIRKQLREATVRDIQRGIISED